MCWKEYTIEYPNDGTFESVTGIPMTVQQAYTEMIGTEDLTMDRYQVYAYLKRLGYSVTRSKPPNAFYPVAGLYPPSMSALSSSYILQRIFSTFSSWISGIFSPLFSRAFDWWRPLRINRWLRSEKNHSFMFRSLRFIPSGHKVPIHSHTETTSPYEPFFNLYKPPTPFKKSAPPPPDYQMVVVNARTTPMPSLSELTAIYDNAPELPLPLPRVRNPSQIQGVSYKKNAAGANIPLESRTTKETITPSMTIGAANGLMPSWFSSRTSAPSKQNERRVNPFAVLRQGTKTAIVATVDAGTINIFRFAQGAFETGPWY